MKHNYQAGHFGGTLIFLLAHFPDSLRAEIQIQSISQCVTTSLSKPIPEHSVKSCVYKNEKEIKTSVS